MPRWLLFPGGVSRALKRRTGPGPWKQLARAGVLPGGGCVITDAGHLSEHTKLIHIAGLNLVWRATEKTVDASVHTVIRAAVAHQMHRIAMPLIGSGSGGLDRASSLHCIEEALGTTPTDTRSTSSSSSTTTRLVTSDRPATGPAVRAAVHDGASSR